MLVWVRKRDPALAARGAEDKGVLCSASLLKRRARCALNNLKIQAGWRSQGQPRVPCLLEPGQGSSAVSSCTASHWLFQLGMLFKKQSLGGDCSSVSASPLPRGFGIFLLPVFPPIPTFLAGFAPEWHSWISAGIATHPPMPSLSAVYLLCLLFASPQLLNIKGMATTQPLEPGPCGCWLGDARRECPIRQRRGGDSWARSPRRQDQLLGAQYAPVFLSSCCC